MKSYGICQYLCCSLYLGYHSSNHVLCHVSFVLFKWKTKFISKSKTRAHSKKGNFIMIFLKTKYLSYIMNFGPCQTPLFKFKLNKHISPLLLVPSLGRGKGPPDPLYLPQNIYSVESSSCTGISVTSSSELSWVSVKSSLGFLNSFFL